MIRIVQELDNKKWGSFKVYWNLLEFNAFFLTKCFKSQNEFRSGRKWLTFFPPFRIKRFSCHQI